MEQLSRDVPAAMPNTVPPPNDLTDSRTVRAVGREGELAQLRSLLPRALGGTIQVVFVTGEARLGQTTLVERCLHDLAGSEALWIGRGCVRAWRRGRPRGRSGQVQWTLPGSLRRRGTQARWMRGCACWPRPWRWWTPQENCCCGRRSRRRRRPNPLCTRRSASPAASRPVVGAAGRHESGPSVATPGPAVRRLLNTPDDAI
jgi:hypothetical protein